MLNARITFGNIQASEHEATHVTTIKQGENVACCIEEECFNPPPTYSRIGKINLVDDVQIHFLCGLQKSLFSSPM